MPVDQLATRWVGVSRGGLAVCVLLALMLAACTTSPAANAPAKSSAPAATAGSSAAPTTGSAAPAPAAPTSVAPATVTVGGLGGNLDDAIWVGEAKGYYAELGLTLDVQRFASAAEMVPLLATGKLDVGSGSMSPALFNAIASGIPVKVVADVTILRDPQKHPGANNSLWMVGRQDLVGELKTVADLKGRTIATNTPGSSNTAQLSQLLLRNGLTLNDVRLEVLSFADALTALSNRAVDAAITVEPYVTLAHERGIAFPFYDMGTGFDGVTAQTLFYGAPFADQRTDVARRFMVAYMRALRTIVDGMLKNVNRDEIVQLYVANTNNKELSLYDRMGFTSKETNGNVNREWMDQLQDFYIQLGLQNRKVDSSALVDSRFSESAVATLGRYSID